MELRHLRYFAAVADALNFTKAAIKLRLAQPALSRQVSDLENELGVDLLKRTSHGVTLTAEGKLFLEDATMDVPGSHSIYVSKPAEVAELIQRAADARS